MSSKNSVLKTCKQCNQQFQVFPFANNKRFCSEACRKIAYYDKRKATWTATNRKRQARASVYSPDKLECPFCHRYYTKLASHTWQRHDMASKELKQLLGRPKKVGLVTLQHKELLQHLNYKNSHIVVDINLVQKGKKTRFKKLIHNQ